MTGEEVAWLAGLYEGEGTCVALHKNGRAPMRLVIGMTDRDVIEKVQKIAGCGWVGTRAGSGTHKDLHVWAVGGEAARQVAEAIYPHLGKRRQDRLALAIGLMTSLRVERNDHLLMKQLRCPKCGGQRTRYPRSNGYYRYDCRPCENASARARRAL